MMSSSSRGNANAGVKKNAPPSSSASATPIFNQNSGTKYSSAIQAQERADQEAQKRRQQGPWLHAWLDPLANVKAFSDCVHLADLKGDGEYSLVIADWKRRLRVYTNTNLVNSSILLGVPTAMATFYPASDSAVPSLAVAIGSRVYIYRSMHPYYMFNLPPVQVSSDELEIWQRLDALQSPYTTSATTAAAAAATKSQDQQTVNDDTETKQHDENDKNDNCINSAESIREYNSTVIKQCCEELNALSFQSQQLTQRSLRLLAVADNVEKGVEFVASHKGITLLQHTVVTCMESLHKTVNDAHAVSQLVVGTENCELLILHPTGSSVLTRVRLPSVPTMMATYGVYDNDYRIAVACRDGRVYVVKKGKLMGVRMNMPAQPCGLRIVGKCVVVACMDKTIQAFRFKGQREYILHMPHTITNIATMHVRRSGVDVVVMAVALTNGDVRLYNQTHLIHTMENAEPIRAMRMGPYGREDAALVLCYKGGGLCIKLMPRKVELQRSAVAAAAAAVTAGGHNKTGNSGGAVSQQDDALRLQKSQLFAEQLTREHSQAIDIHRVFQRDLCKLRLTTARAYTQLIQRNSNASADLRGTAVRLDAQVHGLGPYFRVSLALKNTTRAPIMHVTALISYNQQLYRIEPAFFRVPILMPNVRYEFNVMVESIDETGASDLISVMICNPNKSVPYITAKITMPLSEPLLDD